MPSTACGADERQRVVQRNEKGHDFDPDTETCTRCGMTIREYKDHGQPPCRDNKGERPARSVDRRVLPNR